MSERSYHGATSHAIHLFIYLFIQLLIHSSVYFCRERDKYLPETLISPDFSVTNKNVKSDIRRLMWTESYTTKGNSSNTENIFVVDCYQLNFFFGGRASLLLVNVAKNVK